MVLGSRNDSSECATLRGIEGIEKGDGWMRYSKEGS
jgi:hypothetical protein